MLTLNLLYSTLYVYERKCQWLHPKNDSSIQPWLHVKSSTKSVHLNIQRNINIFIPLLLNALTILTEPNSAPRILKFPKKKLQWNPHIFSVYQMKIAYLFRIRNQNEHWNQIHESTNLLFGYPWIFIINLLKPINRWI